MTDHGAGAPPLRAAIYLRISRPDEGDILKNQRATAAAYAMERGWEVHAVYEDIASGGTDDRPDWNRLLDDARARRFRVVVFTSLSRMTRGGVEAALYLLNRLKEMGVGWHFTEQPVLNYDAGTAPLARDIILAVLAAVDEDYRRRVSSHTKAAHAKRKALAEARGQPLGWGRHHADCGAPGGRPCPTGKHGPNKGVPPAPTRAAGGTVNGGD